MYYQNKSGYSGSLNVICPATPIIQRNINNIQTKKSIYFVYLHPNQTWLIIEIQQLIFVSYGHAVNEHL